MQRPVLNRHRKEQGSAGPRARAERKRRGRRCGTRGGYAMVEDRLESRAGRKRQGRFTGVDDGGAPARGALRLRKADGDGGRPDRKEQGGFGPHLNANPGQRRNKADTDRDRPR